MIGKERPGIAPSLALRDDPLQPLQEIITILIVTENLASLDAAPDNVMQRPGCVYSGLSGHALLISETADIVNMKI